MKILSGIVIAVLATASQCWAAFGISGTSGDVVEQSQPADARVNVLESNETVRAWFEGSTFLEGDVDVDVATSTNNQVARSPVVSGGQSVRSYMVHSDTVGSSHLQFSGSISFDQQILGVIFTNAKLVLSDFLTSTLHSSNRKARGFEIGSDKFHISADGLTLFIDRLDTSTVQDEIRIITADSQVNITAVPEPASLAIWGAASLLGAVVWRRRKAA